MSFFATARGTRGLLGIACCTVLGLASFATACGPSDISNKPTNSSNGGSSNGAAPGSGGAASGGSSNDTGGVASGGATTGSGGTTSTGGTTDNTGGTTISTGGGGGGQVTLPDFVPPTDTNNDASNICQRVAEIQCAGQAHCCQTAQNVQLADCIASQVKGCQDSGLAAIATNSKAGYDLAAATTRLNDFQTAASTCDPNIAIHAASADGLRGVLQGTVSPGGDCKVQPATTTDTGIIGAYLASCTDPKNNACLPTVLSGWKCASLNQAGGTCFSDANCAEQADPTQSLYCAGSTNAPLLGANGKCTVRKPSGSTCKDARECQTLVCINGTCADNTVENVYCITVAP